MFGNKSKYPIAIDISGHDIFAAQLKPLQKGYGIKGLAQKKGNNNSGNISEMEEILP